MFAVIDSISQINIRLTGSFAVEASVWKFLTISFKFTQLDISDYLVSSGGRIYEHDLTPVKSKNVHFVNRVQCLKLVASPGAFKAIVGPLFSNVIKCAGHNKMDVLNARDRAIPDHW